MPAVKAYKFGLPGAPYFPDDFEIVKKAVLQVTDIKSNHNKYYAIELHKAAEKGKVYFRVFTHYGRTDDLETNPDAGQKECRFFSSVGEAEANYQSILREKTSAKKGYKEVALASSKIGSQKARGTSTGEVDEKTLKKIQSQTEAPKPLVKASSLHDGVKSDANDIVKVVLFKKLQS
ncbi:MAG: WGR domain-containing protein [Gemmataceae bacterium]|nr:WGR domain-containing protein [Gemmataceae bacterium]